MFTPISTGSHMVGALYGHYTTRRVEHWAITSRVTLCQEETCCVMFYYGLGGMERVRPSIRVGSSEKSLNKFVDTLRVLDVVTDRRLSFFAHADHLKEKVNHLAAKVVTFKNMAGNLRPDAFRHLYKQVMRPTITYASIIWWPERPDCRLKSHLIRIQHSALLALTGAYRTTRTAALQVLMHAPPIEMELRLLNKEFALLRMRRKITEEGQAIDPWQVALSMEKLTFHPAKTLHVQKVVFLVTKAREIARRPGINVYRDGAYSLNSAGAAYVAFGRATSIVATGRFRVLDASSAYCTEVVALKEALQYHRSCNSD
ncbi:hypothetical protein MRX96_020702 [Rhipicephalus microplus]